MEIKKGNFFFSLTPFFVDLNSLIPKKHTLVGISAFMDWPFFMWNVRLKYSPAFELRHFKGWITKDLALKTGSVWCWVTVQGDAAWLWPEMLSLQRVCFYFPQVYISRSRVTFRKMIHLHCVCQSKVHVLRPVVCVWVCAHVSEGFSCVISAALVSSFSLLSRGSSCYFAESGCF